MGLANQLVIFGVHSNPKPDDSVRCRYSHRSVTETHTSGPVATYLFEMQRWMLRVCLQECKGFVGLFTELGGRYSRTKTLVRRDESKLR